MDASVSVRTAETAELDVFRARRPRIGTCSLAAGDTEASPRRTADLVLVHGMRERDTCSDTRTFPESGEPRDLLHGATRSYDARKRSMSAVSRASAGAGVGRANHAGSGRPFLMDQVPVAAPRLSTTGLSIPPPLRM